MTIGTEAVPRRGKVKLKLHKRHVSALLTSNPDVTPIPCFLDRCRKGNLQRGGTGDVPPRSEMDDLIRSGVAQQGESIPVGG